MSGPATVRLDDQLCFALYAATNAVVRSYRPLLHRIGLTYPQYLLMMVLWQSDGLSINEIADRLDLAGNAVTPLASRLADLGYVTRSRDQADRRVVVVRLTSAGSELEREAAAAQRKVVCRTGLNPAALADLRVRLHHLFDDMRAPTACDGSIEGDRS